MTNISKKDFLENNSNIFFNKRFEKMDLSNMDIRNKKFIYCDLSNVKFEYANMTNCSLENSLLDGTSLKYAILDKANLKSTSFRECDMTGVSIKGAYLYSAILEKAKLDNIIYDNDTKYFELFCPVKGAFIAYKKCLEDRLVTLYVPEDALRTSSTMECCRTNKAKVIKITDFKEEKIFDEAWSTVAEDFCYKVGEWVEVKNFNADRWFDSTTGIHFWMSKKAAMNY